METISILNLLFLVAFGLLVLISGGILYLTILEWRDRSRQDQDKKSAKR